MTAVLGPLLGVCVVHPWRCVLPLADGSPCPAGGFAEGLAPVDVERWQVPVHGRHVATAVALLHVLAAHPPDGVPVTRRMVRAWETRLPDIADYRPEIEPTKEN